jgi:undecaprenyl-diphosphatase
MPVWSLVRARARDWLRVRDLDLIGALLLVALFLLAFLQLADAIQTGPLSIDQRILLALRSPVDVTVGRGGPTVEGVVRDITALGSPTLAILFSLTVVGWLLLTDRPGAALFVTIAMLGAWALNDGLKELFDRQRPSIVPHLVDLDSPSFPSGHTMVSAVFYPTLAELLGRLVHQSRVRFYLMGVALGVAVLVGFSRIYLAMHYPSDVLGGLAVGFAWALLCGIVARLLQRRHVFRSGPRDGTDAEAESATP